jgi:hypothetical protein
LEEAEEIPEERMLIVAESQMEPSGSLFPWLIGYPGIAIDGGGEQPSPRKDSRMAKKKGSDKRPSTQEPTPQAPKKPAILGSDHALTLLTPQSASLDLSYWDLWFCIVAVQMHDSDLHRLADHIKDERGFHYDRRSVERKRSHIRDLKRRLDEADMIPADIVLAAPDLARTEKRRAITKVSESINREREFSEPMKNTPRERRYPQALRGSWNKFPVSPQPYAKKIGAHFRSKTFYSENASFKIARTLDGYVEEARKLLATGKASQAQALLRGWMTVVIELIEKADDSCGSIGDSFDEGFTDYLKIPLNQTGIDERVFFPDLLDFLIWEDYGLTDDAIEGYFQGLNERQADLCVEHLRREVTALREDDLDYQSEEALTFLGRVIAEQERFDEFENLARQMGSRAWQRIIRLVDRAMKRRKKPLAMNVLEASLTKGDHLDFLTKKYEKLKHGNWSPDPRK